jgi:sugar lactone lactonase YvrE
MKQRILKYLLFSFGIILLLFSCKVPEFVPSENMKSHQVTTNPGPEDIVLDTISDANPRIIISCDTRRTKEKSGSIQAMDVNSEKVMEIQRIGEPERLVFHPHGIDLVKLSDGSVKLYVVNHNEAEKKQSILIYQLKNNQLIFEKQLIDESIASPNDVTGTPDGTIYFSNEFHKRNARLAAILGLKTGYFVSWNGKEFTKREKGFCYANSMAIFENTMYTTGSRNRFLYKSPQVFSAKSKKKKFAKIPGADNISIANNKAYVACHVNLFKFLKHVDSKENKTPTVIYEIDLKTAKKRVFYVNNDGQINGASTAIYFQGRLYLSQIFEPYLLVVEGLK